MYLDLYKIDGTINNDTEPCFHNPDTYPKFQEELESLINLKHASKDIKQKLETILDQVRTMLNEQVKASIKKKFTGQKTTKNDVFWNQIT